MFIKANIQFEKLAVFFVSAGFRMSIGTFSFFTNSILANFRVMLEMTLNTKSLEEEENPQPEQFTHDKPPDKDTLAKQSTAGAVSPG